MSVTFKQKLAAMRAEQALNPTAQFISTPEEAAPAQAEAEPVPEASEPPKPRKTYPRRNRRSYNPPETRSRRLQLLIKPSLYETVAAEAEAEGCSVNELINQILSDALTRKY